MTHSAVIEPAAGAASRPGAVLDAEHLCLSFGPRRVLNDVSLTVASGEVLAVMGPSGSGKSSLLHCLAGLLRPESGTVALDGERLEQLSDRERSRRRLAKVGFVSQFGDLVPELTLRENVELPLRLLRRPRRVVNRDGAALLDALGIADVADRRAGDVSGGQLQRAAVCRALAHRPAVVLADEPTGSLDTVSGDLVVEALVAAARQLSVAVVLVTHEARIASYADRELVLRDGRIVEDAAGVAC